MTLSTLNLTPTDHHEAVTPLIRYVVLVLVYSAQRFVVPFARFLLHGRITLTAGKGTSDSIKLDRSAPSQLLPDSVRSVTMCLESALWIIFQTELL